MKRCLLFLFWGAWTAFATAQEAPVSGIADNHEWVDLGLSVKWATCNIGAQSPSDFGDFFAWGETMAKKKFTWKNYKYRLDGDDVRSVRFTQYNTVRGRGKVDNNIRLFPTINYISTCSLFTLRCNNQDFINGLEDS